MITMYELLNGQRCQFNNRHAATLGAVYTFNISILVVLLYSWRINLNASENVLGEVYYGVQIAIIAIITAQLSLIGLSACLFVGIIRERPGLIVPWIIGLITFMALEAVCIVYSNVLRDHINKGFDALCKAEVAFFIARGILSVLALVGVVRYYQDLRCGISWKAPEAIEV